LANDSSEIEKLTERIAKDPKSKLFVPLAEEYKKAGDIEMAIQVLTDGLKANPGYVTARSFLGKLLLDRGDIAGAQKELEEVIKAIPDNLLAQRKLGDVYVLQGRGNDAQQRYKAALALNPADKELPSLIADLAAGRDVSARVPRPKMAATSSAKQAAPAPAQPKPAPAVAVKPAASAAVLPAAMQKAAPAAPAAPIIPKTEVPHAATAALKTEGAPVAPVAPKTEATPAATTALKVELVPAATAETIVRSRPTTPAAQTRDEAEVIEDIVEIEHLEKPASDMGLPAFDIPTHPDATMAEAFEAPAFDLTDASITASTDAGDLMDISWGTDTFSVPPAATVEESSAASDEVGDDLNTNTLAELYISQGFYDKAIEVYQGMLGERPDNKPLQEKLEKLRALAGAAGQSVSGPSAAVPAPIEPVPTASTVVVEEPVPPVEVPSQQQQVVSRQTRGASQPEPPTVAEAALEKGIKEAEPESPAGRGPRATTMRRKETIDRLESWLTKIMKEKK
jgi:tetratricopeptide (TPR) repeat protein